MKLARPDLRHPRIVLAGCRARVEGDGDDAGLVAALRARGLHARWLAWDDPEVDGADVVILRATWDYVDRLDDFLAWTRRVPNLLNAPDVVAWNTDKRYLVDLEAAGVPIVPSAFFAPADSLQVPTGEVMVQPYDPHIAAIETALVFLAGEQSHAFTKAPLLPPPGGGPVLDGSHGYAAERLRPAEPDFELWDVGHQALTAAAEHLGIAPREFLYARVDLIGDRDDPRLLELQLIEPSLGWRQLSETSRADAQRRFALAVESALQRLGLGPL